MTHPLDKARQRLKRADENIRNLNSEISAFLFPLGSIPFQREFRLTDENRKTLEEIREYAVKGEVPPRFIVLAGEIIHHLRSAFDHIAWELSATEMRGRDTEFPVCRDEPTCAWQVIKKKVKHSSYCTKVKGISSISALAHIERLQPYKRLDAVDPLDHPLFLIHDMDISDKHKGLIIVRASMGAFARATVTREITKIRDAQIGFTMNIPIVGSLKVDVEGNIAPRVAFKELGSNRKNEPVVPLLQKLYRFTVDAVESFAGEFH